MAHSRSFVCDLQHSSSYDYIYIFIAGCLAGTHHYRQFFTPFILIIHTSMTLQGIHSFFFIPDSSMKKIRNLPDSLQNSIPSHFYENESFLPYSKPNSDVVFTHHLSMIKTAFRLRDDSVGLERFVHHLLLETTHPAAFGVVDQCCIYIYNCI